MHKRGNSSGWLLERGNKRLYQGTVSDRAVGVPLCCENVYEPSRQNREECRESLSFCVTFRRSMNCCSARRSLSWQRDWSGGIWCKWCERCWKKYAPQCAATSSPGQESAAVEEIEDRIVERVNAELRPSLRAVINATGVILHTNLGRAPLPTMVAEACGRQQRNIAIWSTTLQRGHVASVTRMFRDSWNA